MKKILTIMIGVLVFTLVTYTVYGTPGDEKDPLVSKSYVDDLIENIKNEIKSGNNDSSGNVDEEKIVKEVMEQIELVYGDTLGGNGSNQSGNQSSSDQKSSTYKPLEVKQGQTLYGGEGSEIILRSGTGKTYITAVEGISNITTGENYASGVEVPTNNLLIVPRSDGRGISVTSDVAWFLVRGDYSIK
ncbi:MAG: hypothetical protein ACK5LT_06050 [Lachnospirales bacterium]